MEVSVIIPTYQSEKYILRAIRSVINQNWNRNNYEIIVVNDGSTDNTEKVLDNVMHEIIYIKHENNLGLSAARNSGVKKAKGRFILFLDSDDYIHTDALKIGHLFLSLNGDLDAVEFDYILVDERENHLEQISALNQPIACGIFYRMEQLIDIGLFDENFLAREDEDFRIRFSEKYSITNVKLPLYRYRRHSSNMTNNQKLMDIYQMKLKNKHRG